MQNLAIKAGYWTLRPDVLWEILSKTLVSKSSLMAQVRHGQTVTYLHHRTVCANTLIVQIVCFTQVNCM